jgi:hypothetical protein
VVVRSEGKEEMAPAAEEGDRRSVGAATGEGLLLDGLHSSWWQRWLAFAAIVRLQRERSVCVQPREGRESKRGEDLFGGEILVGRLL